MNATRQLRRGDIEKIAEILDDAAVRPTHVRVQHDSELDRLMHPRTAVTNRRNVQTRLYGVEGRELNLVSEDSASGQKGGGGVRIRPIGGRRGVSGRGSVRRRS